MSFVSGKFQICADPECDCTDLTTVNESWDARESCFVGEQSCTRCGCAMLYSRKPETPEERAMAKKTAKKKPTRKTVHEEIAEGRTRSGLKPAESPSAGARTVKSNGGLSEGHSEPVPEPEKVNVGEAMRRAVEALGDLKIDDELAPRQMAELAELLEDITKRRAAFNLKNDEAKTAKKSLESVTELLLEKLKSFTHPAPLPLFDTEQAEDDLEDMLDASAGDGVGADA
jgi:hypothetical protein